MTSKPLRLLLATVLLSLSVPIAACGKGPEPKASSPQQVKAKPSPKPTLGQLQEMVRKGTAILVDVRTVAEYKAGHAGKSINIPLGELGKRVGELDRKKPIVAICRSGRRSQVAVEWLQGQGFRAYNGGVWDDFR
ncbi:MAG: hypothetical protein CSA07_03470 [Bacteroidia bacterium]|nr:MAG: hypothetical protein CSA07_03470 [Bacteroidia bacterium]